MALPDMEGLGKESKISTGRNVLFSGGKRFHYNCIFHILSMENCVKALQCGTFYIVCVFSQFCLDFLRDLLYTV